MRKLRVIGSSPDFDELILSNKPRGRAGTHAVAIDRKLLDVLQKAVYGRRDAAKSERGHAPARIESESKLPPREIQRLLRAGQSLGQVARQSGMTEEYVEQFLTPVLYERAGAIQDAQALFQEKARLGPSSLPLGEAVAANLTARRVSLDEEAFADAWTASRQEGQPWVVGITFPFRGRARTARWRFEPRARTLEPANKLAADVGWIASSRAQAYVASKNGSKAEDGKAAAKRPARKRATRKKPTSRRKPASKKKPARKKTARRKPAARKAASRKRKTSARRKAAPRKKAASRKKATPRRRAASRKPARRKASPRKAAARGRSTKRRRR